VFRNETGCNAGFTKIASGTAATALSDTAVADGLTYYYQISAFPSGNESCASAPSACITVSPVAAPCIPPASAPATLTATAGTGNVALAWAAVAGASEYHIYRGTVSGGPYTQVGSATGTTFTDTSVLGTTYFYVVRAANSPTCESGNSPEASATPTASGDFALSISPASVTVGLFGTAANYTVTVTRTGGFTGAVTLSVAGIPSSATATFTPNPATGATSALKVTVKITPRGTFPLTITGVSGTLTHTAAATLIKN
jgi:fibronectin type 3 domain-containing protein